MKQQGMMLALAAVALIGSATMGQDQTQDPVPVPFKATVTGPLPDQFEVPVRPAVYSQRETGTAQADGLGAFQWTGHAMQSEGAGPRTPRLLSEGVGVMKAANGDAIFFRYGGKVIAGIDTHHKELGFVITGGQGRYVGATGSGVFTDTVDFSMQKLTRTAEGHIALPAAK